MYRVSDFAEKAGVTVRTLHHYDRLGLLKPSGRTEAGYRLYGERDFGRLQQIVTLKFIALPLRQIKRIKTDVEAGPPHVIDLRVRQAPSAVSRIPVFA